MHLFYFYIHYEYQGVDVLLSWGRSIDNWVLTCGESTWCTTTSLTPPTTHTKNPAPYARSYFTELFVYHTSPLILQHADTRASSFE